MAKTVGGMTTQYLVDDLNPTGYAQVDEELVDGSVTRRYTSVSSGSARRSSQQRLDHQFLRL